MIKHFYSYIIEADALKMELDGLELSPEEKEHLIEIMESNLHHTIIDAILSELSEEDKKTFLFYLHTREHEKIWKLLHAKVEDIEEKIKKAANDLKKEMHTEIKEVKKKKTTKK